MSMDNISNGISTSDKSENISLYLVGNTLSSTSHISEKICNDEYFYFILPLASARTLDSDLS